MSREFRKVEALLAMGRSDEAAALADRLPEREHPTAEYLRLRGRALRAAGRVFDAEASFREALGIAPQDPALLADLATTLLGQKRLGEARAHAREAVALRPDVAAYHCLAGVIADALGDAASARAELQAARTLAPTDAEAHVVYGWHAVGCGEHAEAEGAFRAALAIAPQRAEAHRGLARTHAGQGRWEEAREVWIQALALDPMQRDRVLAKAMILGDPTLRPLRSLTGVPIRVSAGLVALGSITAAFWPGPVGLVLSTLLFSGALVSPLARVALDGATREA